MPLTEYWSREDALTACCEMVRACVPELAAASVYQGDLDATRLRPSCRVYAVSEPVELGWTDEIAVSKLAQIWLITVLAVNVGQAYTVTILGDAASYTAQFGDTLLAVRDEVIAAIAALGKPVSTANASDGSSFTLTGLEAGQHLGVAVTPNMSAGLTQDNLLRQGLMPSTWAVRFEFEEQPGVDGTQSRAHDWATRLRGWLQLDRSTDGLRAAHLDFSQVLSRGSLVREDRGKTTAVEFIDVEFLALVGQGHDVSSIESFGTAPTVEVVNAS